MGSLSNNAVASRVDTLLTNGSNLGNWSGGVIIILNSPETHPKHCR